MNGKPFIIYDKFDKANDIFGLSVGIAVKDSLQLSEKSEVQWANMQSYTAVKSTLIGNHIHLKKTWNETFKYIEKNKLIRNYNLPIIEIYIKGKEDEKQPSKWITEIHIPIYPKVIPKKPVYKKTAQPIIETPSLPIEETSTQ